jgi:hypothetical protein
MRNAQEVLALPHNHIICRGISHYCTTPATKKSCSYMTDNDAQNEKKRPIPMLGCKQWLASQA